jgi:hypothetical protein
MTIQPVRGPGVIEVGEKTLEFVAYTAGYWTIDRSPALADPPRWRKVWEGGVEAGEVVPLKRNRVAAYYRISGFADPRPSADAGGAK